MKRISTKAAPQLAPSRIEVPQRTQRFTPKESNGKSASIGKGVPLRLTVMVKVTLNFYVLSFGDTEMITS